LSYSEQMIEELKAIEGLDYAKATAFATKHMVKPRSVVAKALGLGLAYTKADSTKTTKAAPRKQKAEVVAEILAELNIAAPSLDKVNMADLVAILGALRAD
jgi:CxxC motif-containing protein